MKRLSLFILLLVVLLVACGQSQAEIDAAVQQTVEALEQKEPETPKPTATVKRIALPTEEPTETPEPTEEPTPTIDRLADFELCADASVELANRFIAALDDIADDPSYDDWDGAISQAEDWKASAEELPCYGEMEFARDGMIDVTNEYLLSFEAARDGKITQAVEHMNRAASMSRIMTDEIKNIDPR